MSQLSVQISGQNFRLSCDPGEEDHVARLAAQVDDLIVQVREQFPHLGDLRVVIMACLTLADDNAKLKARLKELDARLAEESEDSHISRERLQQALARAAERIEQLSEQLEDAEAPQDGAGRKQAGADEEGR